jgi:hypothetical protein
MLPLFSRLCQSVGTSLPFDTLFVSRETIKLASDENKLITLALINHDPDQVPHRISALAIFFRRHFPGPPFSPSPRFQHNMAAVWSTLVRWKTWARKSGLKNRAPRAVEGA